MTTLTTATGSTYATSDRIVLHLGVQPRDLFAVTRQVTSELSAAVTTEGDGWNAWGEPVGADANDPSTLHVVADLDRVEGIEADVAAVVTRLYSEGLVQVSTDRWHTVAALSAFEDWSEEAGGLAWFHTPGQDVTQHRYPEPTTH
ncbi:hypothetical protein [Litorihabitans aurantiacus]|uniref:Uncharacterized protein n=1 Tax=Litorihabitans aurantiacus TaxID=1930061 RepID=A0AA37XIB4_9MICO|nr:hypothetical protein [Litorihabitans aurantiacus]GMA33667.1 hypothetical protein GCM10025875_36590 [Litorihabitans aurantiacus]GMA33736.1 hypothetical protein GCM10025875_37280 [Litorihabitans aurantiacus]